MLRGMKGEINSNTIIAGDFTIRLTPMDKSIKQKSSKETEYINDTMDQLDLIDIYKAFHPKTMSFLKYIQNILQDTKHPGPWQIKKKKKKMKSFQASFLITMQ